MKFEELGLTPEILKAVTKMGFETPTPVQAKVIPRLLENKGDLVALAQTGTGKTAAFGLPILNMIDHNNRTPQALILCPTRELCVQITRDLDGFAALMPAVKIVAVYGGTPIVNQLRALQRGVQIVVATPGRIHDIIRRKKINLGGVERVILDEADEMLNMGFQEDLEAILSEVPDKAHTLLFSATMPRQVSAIARNYMDKPEEITVGQRNAGAENVSHECYIVHQRDRYSALKRLADYYPDMYAIVFCRTRHDTQTVANWLIRDGYNVDALHGDLSQAQRDRVMGQFRSKALQVLVATDVAARGLDVTDLTHVINYNLPDDLGSYTHRSGRTGRAGKSGVSVVIINMVEKSKVRRIEKMINKTFQYRDVPSGNDICEAQLFSMIDRMKGVEVDHKQIDSYLPKIQESLKDMERDELIKRFVALEFDVLLKYYRGAKDLTPSANVASSHTKDSRRRKDQPRREERGRGGRREERKPESNDQRMFINLGKLDGLSPKKLAGMIKGEGKCDATISRVDIMEKFSFFEVPKTNVVAVIGALGALTHKKRAIRVEPVEDNSKSKRIKRTDRRKNSHPGQFAKRKSGQGGKRKQGGPNKFRKSK